MVKDKPDAYVVAGQFLTDRYVIGKESQKSVKVKTLRWWKGDFYTWEDGWYDRLTDNEIKAEIAEYLHEQNMSVTTHSIATIMICLCRLTDVGREVVLNSWLDGVKGARVFPLQNGNVSFTDIDIKTNKPRLLPHTPWYFTLTRADYDYDPKAKCPMWEAFLHDVMDCNMNYISLLQQFVGYLFRPDLNEQKFLLCTGEGANGKGVFFKVIQALVGERNCSELGLHSFNPKINRFGLYTTLGKMVNMTNESSHIIEHEGENILKSYVAGDIILFERKFREPLTARPTAKLMIASNSLPRFNDRTNAIWRRILLVPFPKIIEDKAQIKDLAEQLKRELSGIFNWALDGLDKLNAAGRFIEPQLSKELLEEYRRDSDPARAFLLENYIYSPNGCGQPCNKLYQEYVQYCEKNGCRPMRNTQFGQHVKRTFPQTERVRLGCRDERTYIYKGLVSYVSQQIPI